MFVTAVSPATYSGRFFVRLGLYTGAVLSLQHALLLAVGGGSVMDKESFEFLGFGVIATAVPLGAWWILKKCMRRWGRRKTWICFLVVMGSFYGAAIVFFNVVDRDIAEILCAPYILFPILFLAAGPFWSSAIYIWLSVQAFREARGRAGRRWIKILSCLGWVGGYMVAWKVSIYSAMKFFATLPKEPPDCYIATAAAKGHRRIVNSEEVVLHDGRVVRVNAQMRYLKCAELMLKAVAPGLHRICRRVYNALGSVLAKGLVRPVLADAAYFMLKPLEWFSWAVVKVVFQEVDDVIKRIYRFDIGQ
jgi:hypothetical protein